MTNGNSSGPHGRVRGILRNVLTEGVERTGIMQNRFPRVIEYHSIGHNGGYDNISPSTFRRHLAWLTNTHEVVPLSELCNPPLDGTKRVAITFDDGLTSYLDNALPILRSFDVPSTVFIIGAVVQDEPRETLEHIRRQRLETTEPLLTEAQLETLVADPSVSLGAHTLTHPELSLVEDKERLRGEIRGSKTVLEDRFETTIRHFAYPYDVWDRTSHPIVKDAFDIAVQGGGERHVISEVTDKHLIPRIRGGVELPLLRYAVHDVSTLMRLSSPQWA